MENIDQIAIAEAIQKLKSRRPPVRGRRAAIAPFVDEIKSLIAAGWTRQEIIAEIKLMGGQISPALLRDVLGIQPASQKRRVNK